ncbi:MAG TPA: Trp biosynthesis-associated membrane protein [Actinomycetota bacterium]
MSVTPAPRAAATRLRVAGFAAVVVGALLAGIGATSTWASIGFSADMQRAADVPLNGTDVWEGKAIMLAVLIALAAVLALRLASSGRARRAMAILVIVLGVTCAALPILDAVRARHRFGGGEGVDRVATILAAQLALPVEVVRRELTEAFEAGLRVEIQPGLWLTVAGGILMVVGGALGLRWVRASERGRAASGAEPERA